MDFGDEDIRPFTGAASRPVTGGIAAAGNDDMPGTPPSFGDDTEASERPVTGFRPLTGMRPMTGSAAAAAGGGQEYDPRVGSARPKTGYRQASARVGTARQQSQAGRTVWF